DAHPADLAALVVPVDGHGGHVVGLTAVVPRLGEVGGIRGILAVAAELHLGRAHLEHGHGAHGQPRTLVVGVEDGAVRAERGAVGGAESAGEAVRGGVEHRGGGIPHEHGGAVEGGVVQIGEAGVVAGGAAVGRVEL